MWKASLNATSDTAWRLSTPIFILTSSLSLERCFFQPFGIGQACFRKKSRYLCFVPLPSITRPSLLFSASVRMEHTSWGLNTVWCTT